jgi:ubiquinone/menaquinone biosynthesis C-methylase UbiE
MQIKNDTEHGPESGFTAEELEANHRAYLSRQEMFRFYGYDNEKERLFIIRAALPVTGRMLEAGTGMGHMTLKLAKMGYKLTTYDVDPAAQRIARMNIAYAGLTDNVNFVIEGRGKLGFNDGSFDTLFCVNTLHHLADSAGVIYELLRILSNKGKLILSDFTTKTFEIMDRVHKSEGRKHDVIGWSMDKAAEHIKVRGYKISEIADDYQRVFVIQGQHTADPTL